MTKFAARAFSHKRYRPSLLVFKHCMLNGHVAIFLGGPRPPPAMQLFGINFYALSGIGYGPMWRDFRRNFAAVSTLPIVKNPMPHMWSVHIIIERLREAASASPNHVVQVREIFEHSVILLTFVLCFDEKSGRETLRRVVDSMIALLSFTFGLNMFIMADTFCRYLFKKSNSRPCQSWMLQHDTFLPRIRSRLERKEAGLFGENTLGVCYLDRLLDICIEDKRSLIEDEILFLCVEFLTSSVETTTCALKWIMKNLVKNCAIQEKLAEEILKKPMDDYLKAVDFEGLRCHPLAHLLIPHAVRGEQTQIRHFEFFLHQLLEHLHFFFPITSLVARNQIFAVEESPLELSKSISPVSSSTAISSAETSSPPDSTRESLTEAPQFTNNLREMLSEFTYSFILLHHQELKLTPQSLNSRLDDTIHSKIQNTQDFPIILCWFLGIKLGVDLLEKHGLVVSMKNPLRACISNRRTSLTS
ncbi:cytochrome P450 89A2-like [Wolffia australiana]